MPTNYKLDSNVRKRVRNDPIYSSIDLQFYIKQETAYHLWKIIAQELAIHIYQFYKIKGCLENVQFTHHIRPSSFRFIQRIKYYQTSCPLWPLLWVHFVSLLHFLLLQLLKNDIFTIIRQAIIEPILTNYK